MRISLVILLSLFITQNAYSQFQEFEYYSEYGEEYYGVVNIKTGDTLIPGKYDEIYTSDLNTSLFVVGKEEQYGVINKDAKEIIALEYSRIDINKEGYIRVKKGGDYYGDRDSEGLFGMCDASGKQIIDIKYAYLGEIYEGLIRANIGGLAYLDGDGTFSGEYDEVTGGTWGFIDLKGKTKIPFNLTYARDFKDGLAKVYVGGSNNDWVYGGKWTYINSKGDPFISDDYGLESGIVNGLIQISKKETIVYEDDYDSWADTKIHYGIVTSKGKVVIEPKYESIEFVDNKFIILKEMDTVKNVPSCVLYGFDLKQIGESGYEDLSPISLYVEKSDSYLTRFIVEKHEVFGMIDGNGSYVLPLKYTEINTDFGKYINIRKGGLIETDYYSDEKIYNGVCGIVDFTGSDILPQVYDEVGYPFEYEGIDIFIARKSGKWGIVDVMNHGVIPFRYDSLIIINNYEIELELFLAKKNGKWGVINILQEERIPLKFDQFRSDYMGSAMVENLIWATYKGKDCIIDAQGNFRLPPKYKHITDISYWKQNRVLIRENDALGISDTLGNLIIPIAYDEINILSNGELVLRKTINEVVNPSLKTPEVGEYSKVNSWDCFVIEEGEEQYQNVCPVQKNGKWGLTNFTTGKALFEPQFDEIVPSFSCNVTIVRKGSKYGVINIKGEIIVPIEFNDIETGYCDYETGMLNLYVKKNNLWGAYSSIGKLIEPITNESVQDVPGYEY